MLSQTNPRGLVLKEWTAKTRANLSICCWNRTKVPGSQQTEGGVMGEDAGKEDGDGVVKER